MSRVCAVCGKRAVAGRVISRKGLAKKKGGVGKKTTGISRRRFLPNLQKIRAILRGVPQTIRICTKCLKTGRIRRASFTLKTES